MAKTEKYYKDVDTTFFYPCEETSIENVQVGEIVRIKVQNPLRYGVRELDYFGRIHKITKCYFWLIEYCGPVLEFAHQPINECRSDSVERRNEMPERFMKQWAKTSLVSISKARSERHIVRKTYWKTVG